MNLHIDGVTTAASTAIGRCSFDRARLELRDGDGRVIALRPQAVRVLEHLLAHAGRVVERDALFQAVWPGVVVTDDSLVQCISDIRAALGDEGKALIRTVPRRGYRLDLPPDPALAGPVPAAEARVCAGADAMGVANAEAPTAGAPPEPARDRAVPHTGRPVRPVAAVVGAVLLLAGIAIGLAGWRPGATPPTPSVDAIAVLPFRSDGGADAALGVGLAEDVATDLSRNADLRVISPRSSFPLAAGGASATAIAERLGARYLVDGRVRAESDALRLVVQLVDGTTGRIVWTDDSRLTLPQLQPARDALLQRVAGTLRASIWRDEKQRAMATAPASLDSYTTSLRALGLKHRMAPEALREARALLAPVLQKDPGYAPAWAVAGYVDALDAGLGMTGERTMAQMDDAIALLQRAVALDATLPLAWQGLAVALTWTPRKAEALDAADEALRLAPGDADNRLFRALALLYVERYDEAVAQVQAALAVYPIAPPYVDGIAALVLSANGRHDEALRLSQSCLDKAPAFPTCRANRMFALAALGRMDEARQDFAAMAGSRYLATNQLIGRAGAERNRLMVMLAATAAPAGGNPPTAAAVAAQVPRRPQDGATSPP